MPWGQDKIQVTAHGDSCVLNGMGWLGELEYEEGLTVCGGRLGSS